MARLIMITGIGSRPLSVPRPQAPLRSPAPIIGDSPGPTLRATPSLCVAVSGCECEPESRRRGSCGIAARRSSRAHAALRVHTPQHSAQLRRASDSSGRRVRLRLRASAAVLSTSWGYPSSECAGRLEAEEQRRLSAVRLTVSQERLSSPVARRCKTRTITGDPRGQVSGDVYKFSRV